ncbi:hypothetical protein DFJ74DRAFT_685461 [Hyaloraphidium curvatum]|nr:hypothetical protein DFJ74DRAFT_685461 [Hyaloraphidium curvatum]
MNFWPWPWRNAIHEIMLSEYSILPAWTRCVRDSETSLGHVDGDVECTCSAARCSGALLVNALRHSLAELAVWATLGLALWIFLGWTPLFSLPQVWTHAWSVFLGICFCILFVLFALDPFAYPTPENTMLRLEGRVRRRLVRRALAAFMDRARRAVIAEHPFVSPQELWGSPEEPYMQLHAELRPRWQQAVQSNALPLVYPFFLGLAILLIAASVVGQSGRS